MEWIACLTASVTADPVAALSAPPHDASMVELRMDHFPDLDLRAAIASCPVPVLATLRSAAEGGRGPDDAATRSDILRRARDAGAHLIDLEFTRDLALIDTLGLAPEQLVVSWHDPESTPGDLEAVSDMISSVPARLVKIVPTARSLADLIAVLALNTRHNAGTRRRRRMIAIAMGKSGLASRYLAPLLGPPISFVAWTASAPAAPGQLDLQAMKSVMAHLDGRPQRLYGIVGRDATASLSPRLHAAAYRAHSLPYLMVPITVPHADELGLLFQPLGGTVFDDVGLAAAGWAVTTPYKDAAAAAARLQAPRVRRARAANTLVLGPGGLTAENTDADGVVGSLTALGVDLRGRTAVVQGSGGAARGAAVGLHLAGANVVIRSRTASVAQSVARELEVGWCPPDVLPPRCDILVNATPVGHDPDDPCVFADTAVREAAAAVDMVYAEHQTRFAAVARRHRTPLADGLMVLAYQGFAQFAAFTKRLPPKREMLEALGISSENL